MILGDEEQKQGRVKIKELGLKLPEGDPERDGVVVELKDLVSEVRARLDKRKETDTLDALLRSLNTGGVPDPSTMKEGSGGV